AFRRALDRAQWAVGTADGSTPNETARFSLSGSPPGVRTLLGAATVIGVSAGFLGPSFRVARLHSPRQITPSSLRRPPHAVWMVPVAETILTVGVALGLIVPALVFVNWRRRRDPARVVEACWTWEWAGAVLGTLLVFGPLLRIPGLHSASAALILALGVGI